MTHPAPSTPPPSSPKRALILGGGLIALVLLVFVLGKMGVIPSGDRLTAWMGTMAGSPWGLPVVIIVFCIGAFLGVPQVVLIGAAVAVFGPWMGFIYCWIAYLASGTLTFWTGRLGGEANFKRYAGRAATKLSDFVGRNTFATSALVRIVPTGPFILVNMAFGVSGAKFRDYLAGLAVGTAPKIALVAFAGQSLLSAMKGNPGMAVVAAVCAVGVYVGLMMFARRRTAKKRQSVALIKGNTVDTPINDAE